MSSPPVSDFPVRCPGFAPAAISLDPITALDARTLVDPFRALAEMPYIRF